MYLCKCTITHIHSCIEASVCLCVSMRLGRVGMNLRIRRRIDHWAVNGRKTVCMCRWGYFGCTDVDISNQAWGQLSTNEYKQMQKHLTNFWWGYLSTDQLDARYYFLLELKLNRIRTVSCSNAYIHIYTHRLRKSNARANT